MAEIILCRHGYTPANADSCNGEVSIRDAIYYDELCPLDVKYGRKQADELGEFLADNYKDKKILLCYGSHYRTRETMSHVKNYLSKENDVTTCCVPAIREINQGLNYAKFRSMFAEDDYEADNLYANIKGPHRVGISYMQGESEAEVRQRVRTFAKKLKSYQATSQINGEEYDLVIAISHSTTIKAIYYDMYRKSTEIKMSTAGAMKVSENPELIFKPATQVPEDHVVNFNEYNDYYRLREFYNYIDELKTDVKFHAFFGGHIRMPLVDDTQTDIKSGSSITSLPINTDKKAFYLIDSVFGKDSVSYDKKSTSTYWVLEGEGEFYVNGNEISVKKGDVIKVPAKATIYYKGQMKLIEKVEPDFKAENVVELQSVVYDKKPIFNYVPRKASYVINQSEML